MYKKQLHFRVDLLLLQSFAVSSAVLIGRFAINIHPNNHHMIQTRLRDS